MTIARKRIALFVGQADESYQNRFITGFTRHAFQLNMDVCVFSMYKKYQDTAVREEGDSNIFSLMNPALFSAAVILKDSIQTANAAQNLETRLKSSFDKPILVIEKESDHFPSICTDGYAAMSELVEHLVTVHGCQDIAFLSGKKWHKHSKERLKAFTDTMEAHGLSVPEDHIFYGDFWYQSGEMCAEQLLSTGNALPEAVVCSNDQMAIGLCKALDSHGIRIPEDIRVVGYDSTFEGQTSPRSITSSIIPAEEFGEYAMDFLLAEMEGREPDSFKLKPHLLIGESCGCAVHTMPAHSLKRTEWETDISSEGYTSVFNTLREDLLIPRTMEEFLGTVYSYVYQIGKFQSFHLCIPTNWESMCHGEHIPNKGYPESMIEAICFHSDHKNNTVGLERHFQTKAILPDLTKGRDEPTVCFFTPLFFEEECFGYAAVNYGNTPRCYDEIYRKWITTLARGFEGLRRNMLLHNLQEELDRIKNSKFSAAILAYEGLNEKEKIEYDLVRWILDENLLTYHFQPIVNTKDGGIYSYEALMRSKTETPISPLKIIKYATLQGRLSDVERATFLNVLKIVDEHYEEFGHARVFINSIPGVQLQEEDYDTATRYLRKYADTIVVELTEEAELPDEDLHRMKEILSELNVDIAVDDYGTGYSNISNLLRYMPNLVKIDRALLSDIQNDPQKQHFVREIIEFCHDNRILALAEGIETSEELRTVIHLGADLVQGFYTGRPEAHIITEIDPNIRNEIKQYHQERLDGTAKKIHIAGKTNRVSLPALHRNGCTDIIIGREGMVYKDIAIIGTPAMKTDIHLRIEPHYCGRITLEDVYFSNVKNRPCIELGDYADVTLVLKGDNILVSAGIQVPETARLVLEGDGNLKMRLNAPEFYGIGNTLDSRCGEIIFEQDGILEIIGRGQKGVCIGAGLGGKISVHKGEYALKLTGDICVGFGFISGKTVLNANACRIEGEFSVTAGVGIGSIEVNTDINISSSSFSFYGDGRRLVGIGTLEGERASVSTHDAGVDIDLRGDYSTCMGALKGASDIVAGFTSFKLESAGEEALAMGGYNESTNIFLKNCDTQVDLRCSIGRDTFAPAANIRIVNGRQKFRVNNTEIERELVYDYE